MGVGRLDLGIDIGIWAREKWSVRVFYKRLSAVL
jgi:hypothetical protein